MNEMKTNDNENSIRRYNKAWSKLKISVLKTPRGIKTKEEKN